MVLVVVVDGPSPTVYAAETESSAAPFNGQDQ